MNHPTIKDISHKKKHSTAETKIPIRRSEWTYYEPYDVHINSYIWIRKAKSSQTNNPDYHVIF